MSKVFRAEYPILFSVGPDLRPPGMGDVFVIGDTALAHDVVGEPLPGIAPVAKPLRFAQYERHWGLFQ